MDKKSKKNLIIRLIVYPILIVIVFLLGRVFFWKEYAKYNPEQAKEMHILGMKLRGIEYCETPGEAVQKYAEALIKGDRDEALIYI